MEPVHANYPFMNAEAIAATQQRHPTTHTASKPRGDRARVLSEDRAIHPREDRRR